MAEVSNLIKIKISNRCQTVLDQAYISHCLRILTETQFYRIVEYYNFINDGQPLSSNSFKNFLWKSLGLNSSDHILSLIARYFNYRGITIN